MKDDKDKSSDTKKGHVYLVNENQKDDDDDERARARPATQQNGTKDDKKGDDPLSIGESDGNVG